MPLERAWACLPALTTGGSSALIEGLGFVRLKVADLERSIAFYRDGLRFGFEGRDDDVSPQAYLRAGDLHLVLIEYPADSRNRRGAGIQLSVEVSGVGAYHDALVARGLSPTPPADDEHLRFFSIRDPDGYFWTFSQSLG